MEAAPGASRPRIEAAPRAASAPQGDPGAVVDFDALHAALGDLPPPAPSQPQLPASDGRSSATYSSARPHVIPPARGPAADANAPAVIVAPEPPPPPPPPPQQQQVPQLHPNPLSTSTPTSPFTPHAGFAPQATPASTAPTPTPDPIGATMRMPDAPMRVRMPRSPTMVVPRRRGPTRTQKLLVFLSMLLVFVAGGIAVLAYYQPHALGFGAPQRPQAATTQPVAVPTPVPIPTPSATAPATTIAPVVTPPPVATPLPPPKKVAPKKVAPAPPPLPPTSAEPRF